MSLASRFCTPEPSLCAVCRRHAQGLAYLKNDKAKPLWLCDDPDCHRLAKEVARMPLDQLDAIERAASGEAFGQACDYLDGLHKTDLANCSPAELEEFQRIYLTNYEKEMRQRVELAGGAPY